MALVTNFAHEAPKAQIENHKEKPSNDGHDATLKREFARESSVFQLIVDSDDERMKKCKSVQRIRRCLLMLAVACTLGLICTMTALYISERQRRIDLVSNNAKNFEHKQTVSPFSSTGAPIRRSTYPTRDTKTTQKPLINPIMPGCVPVFDAYPLPEVPPEILNLTKQLGMAVEGFQMSQGIKAASVAFSYRGKIWWSKHAGRLNFSDVNSPLPNDDTPYPVASITKLFTTFMLHKLFEKGELKLDDPVTKYVPEFFVKNPFNNEKITLRQLSCMMSGLPREGPCYPHTKHNFCPYNSSSMWERITNLSLILPPDKNPSYSNLGYSVLGRTLERIVGEKYEDWISKNIIKPLGMNNSGFNLLAAAHRFPVSTNLDGSVARIIDWGWQLPAAGLYSTINDLNQVANMLFELLNGTVLHKSTARKLFRPAFLFNSGHGTGYGFEIINIGFGESAKSKPALGYLMYTKSGNSLGYGSCIALIPEFKFAAFALTAHGGKEFAPAALLKIALKAVEPLETILIRSLPEYVLPPSPESYIGNYSLVQYWPLISNLVRIVKKRGTLYLKIEWLLVPLSYESPWVLVTGHFKQYPLGACEDQFLSSGLSKLKCYFRKPSKPGGKSPGFHVYGITAYGFADFKRVN